MSEDIKKRFQKILNFTILRDKYFHDAKTHEKLHLEIQEKLASAKDAKRKHRKSNQCDRYNDGGCTACHFWAGQISAYSGLLGESGVID